MDDRRSAPTYACLPATFTVTVTVTVTTVPRLPVPACLPAWYSRAGQIGQILSRLFFLFDHSRTFLDGQFNGRLGLIWCLPGNHFRGIGSQSDLVACEGALYCTVRPITVSDSEFCLACFVSQDRDWSAQDKTGSFKRRHPIPRGSVALWIVGLQGSC